MKRAMLLLSLLLSTFAAAETTATFPYLANAIVPVEYPTDDVFNAALSPVCEKYRVLTQGQIEKLLGHKNAGVTVAIKRLGVTDFMGHINGFAQCIVTVKAAE